MMNLHMHTGIIVAIFFLGTTPEIVMNVLLECFRELQVNKVATTPSRNSSNHNIPGKISHEILQIPKLVTEWTGYALREVFVFRLRQH